MDTLQAKIDAKYLKVLAPFIAKQDVRYYLNGLCITPHEKEGALLVATNGHVLGIAYDREAIVQKEIIVKITADTIKHSRGTGRGSDRFVEIHDRLMIVDECANEIHVQAGDPIIDGRYPDWRRVVPRKLMPGLYHRTFNAEYLALAKKIAACVDRKYGAICWFSDPDNPDVPAALRLPKMREFIGLIMPMAGNAEIDGLPGWLMLPTDTSSKKQAVA